MVFKKKEEASVFLRFKKCLLGPLAPGFFLKQMYTERKANKVREMAK